MHPSFRLDLDATADPVAALMPRIQASPSTTVWTLVGPTAVGKTALSLDLAEHLGAEIISADSRQVYRLLDIGTAKPTLAERTRVPHHFIDEMGLDEPFAAGMFARAAWERIAVLHARGTPALVVGGSTLYVRALTQGLADIPPIDPTIRAALQERLLREGSAALFEVLAEVDPAFARTLDPTKSQRILRGLEVFMGTGRPLSAWFDHPTAPPFVFQTVLLHRERPQLYARINARVEAMLRQGLVEEVRHILSLGYTPELNPLRTIGYQEVIAFLQQQIDEPTMVAKIKQHSRHYAKRQVCYFAITDSD
jgi:tRNA dimethylallyltransferase